MSSSEPPTSSSPACFAHEADDVYMGYASRAEITAFLKEVDSSAPETAAARTALIHRIRSMLPKVRDDALHRELSALAERLETAK